ncbi:hypothetical protein PLICRDRAFT_31360 [Plicaturopsis crispa FD-325 SS-3]|nr:hypothetical protein PLICRDRAFT_31360 [Plicaturopsis crispa FD-325 SS-3]
MCKGREGRTRKGQRAGMGSCERAWNGVGERAWGRARKRAGVANGDSECEGDGNGERARNGDGKCGNNPRAYSPRVSLRTLEPSSPTSRFCKLPGIACGCVAIALATRMCTSVRRVGSAVLWG